MTFVIVGELTDGTIGFVFQQFNLLPRTSALRQVEPPLMYAGVGARERRERVQQKLESKQYGPGGRRSRRRGIGVRGLPRHARRQPAPHRGAALRIA
jgi:hypothetical protein